MVERYFQKFPLTSYTNTISIDLTRRVALLNRVSKNPYVFYPYDITRGIRPDQLANDYYKDPYLSWLIYSTNYIVDPYYGWYLSEQEFNDFIEKKYGSVREASTKIKYYRNNWESQEPLNVEGYNALPPNMQSYWNPVYGHTNLPIHYVRKEVDWSASTNKIIKYTVNTTSTFTENEIVDIVFDVMHTGQGQVISSSNTEVFVQHVSGQYYEDTDVDVQAGSYLYGNESGANVVFLDNTAIANNIQEEEMIYWEPITHYDYEYERNEFNKTIRVIDSDFSQLAADNLKELLRQD